MELRESGLNEYMTDSGRSSLRLILSSLKDRTFLIPDFLCKSVIDVFNDLEIDYNFYGIRDNLSIAYNTIETAVFDVLYIINYFGVMNFDYNRLKKGQFLIEDNVFLPIFEKPEQVKNWIGYNSYRKISPLADGSLIKSTIKLSADLVKQNTSSFAQLKYKAKNIKHGFIQNGSFSENEYLSLYREAEVILDSQKEIFEISRQSIFRLMDFLIDLPDEYKKRNENKAVLDQYLEKFAIRMNSEYPSYYVLKVDDRDALKKSLMKENIFLPVHWPPPCQIEKPLFNTILSIPLDSRYNEKDLINVATKIHEYYKN